ncbi:MAG: phosphoenolpyruvate synthase [Candidatus Syntropharchaeia archaeon]
MILKGRFVLWFNEIDKEDTSLVGGKCANLGEMTSKTDVPIPPGFATTSEAYKYFIGENNLEKKIVEILKNLNTRDTEALQEKSAEIRKLIEGGKMPPDLEEEIIENYRTLGREIGKDPYVAVRSSATAEDLPGASFAGQQETFLDVRGEENLIKYVKKAYSSLFTPRAISYREEKGFSHTKVYLSCAIQKMVNSKSAGVMFTLNPATGDRNVVLIEGAWGLGETVVQGSVNPDRFVVRKDTLEIVEKEISEKKKMLVRGESGPVEREVPEEMIRSPCLTDDEIRTLTEYGLRIEEHYETPQDIEWALDGNTNKLYILQARPETVWSIKEKETAEKEIILKGLAASPGYASGKVRVIEHVDGIKEFKSGEILVTTMTSPDWVPAMRSAKAIITNDGGMTCHAAIISRELGIPAIVGTRNATKVLKTGMEVTVDAIHGVVYKGVVERNEKEEKRGEITGVSVPITGTKIYCNLAVPEKAEEVAKLPVDGVGLMRVEFIIANEIGIHPLKLIEEGREEEYIKKLMEGIFQVGRAFYPRPVVMRFSDFKTNEYRELEGGEKYEPVESNPMLGWRGASRYTDPRYEPAFRLELKALRRVRERGLKNIWTMVPFCRTVEEMEKILKIMEEEGLRGNKDFKIWLMCEIPSNIILVDEFSRLVDGFSIGSNDLTQLILGVDRDSEILSELFDERDNAVTKAIEYFVRKAHENGKTVSICGQAPSVYPEFCEFLVRCGIDSISVNPDAIIPTKMNVARIERRIELEKNLGIL